MAIEFHTERLHLRRWRDTDREPFAALNADPEVMRYFAAPLTREVSDASIDGWQRAFDEHGWSNWAAALRTTGELIGFIGLSIPRRVLPFSPCVEIGWRLARAQWGRGYASEGARGALRVGFEQIGLEEIVSFTTQSNRPSRAVMERIGLRDTGQDFEYPGLPPGHPQRPHCLYKLTAGEWRALQRMGPVAAEGLALEPQTEAHAEAMFEVLSDPAIYEHENEPPPSIDWLRGRFRRLETRRSGDGTQQWLNWVIRLPSGELIGYVQASVQQDGSAAIAYELASAYWGRGLARRAVEAMVGELVRHHGVTRLVAVAKATNLRSIRLLERLGFVAGDDAERSARHVDADEVLLARPAELRDARPIGGTP
jgi:RimJ/RimL family protein N-acetyltransferase